MAQLSKSSLDQRESVKQDKETPEVNAPCSDSAPPHMAWGAPKAKARLVSAVARQNLEGKLKGKDWQSSDWPGWGMVALGTLAQLIVLIKRMDFSQHTKLRPITKTYHKSFCSKYL